MSKIPVLIIEDHRLLRQSWKVVLDSHPLLEVRGEASSAEEGYEVAAMINPRLILLDINLPGVNGIEATKHLKKMVPSAGIIGVSMHTEISYVKKMMLNGASGYITKSSNRQELFLAIDEVLAGKKYICEHIKNLLSSQLSRTDEPYGFDSLTSREKAIALLVKDGLSSKEIASRLDIAEKTVEVHRYNILRKLHLPNSAALVDYLFHHL